MASTRTISVTVTAVREKLRQAAKESGMTQEEIGLRMGFSKDMPARLFLDCSTLKLNTIPVSQHFSPSRKPLTVPSRNCSKQAAVP